MDEIEGTEQQQRRFVAAQKLMIPLSNILDSFARTKYSGIVNDQGGSDEFDGTR